MSQTHTENDQHENVAFFGWDSKEELMAELDSARQFIQRHDDRNGLREAREEGDLVSLLTEENGEKKFSASSSHVPDEDTCKQRSLELLERDNCESPEVASSYSRSGEANYQLKRAASAPNASLRSSGVDSSELPNPFLEDEFEETSPFLGQSKSSSLWTVSTSPISTSSFGNNRFTFANQRASMSTTGDQGSTRASRENLTQTPADSPPMQSGSDEFVMVEEKTNGSRQPSPPPQETEQSISPALAPLAEEKPKKKKKKQVKGLPLPVRAFKSRSERDPELINQDLRVNFTDVIAEPEGYYTPKFSWNLSQEVYGFAKGCCYSFSTLFCGVPLGFFWGVWFAILACLNVWCLVPIRRSNSIKMSWWKSFWGVIVSSLIDPVFRSIGMVFNNMSVRTEKHIV